jgi:hypothetical protein
MPTLPPEIPLSRWLDYLFAHPVGPSGFRETDDWWDEQADPALAVAYLTRLFEGPDILLERYPHNQIDRGFWFLLGESGLLRPLLEPGVPWEERRRGLLAIARLFERLFAPSCANHLGHLDRGPEPPKPLNSICYMWWDLFPTWGGHGGAQPQPATTPPRRRRPRQPTGSPATDGLRAPLSVDDALLAVMAQTLQLESEPCREGALHGLGHWHRSYPERTSTIVDEWLATEPRISPALRQYALSARAGCVL